MTADEIRIMELVAAFGNKVYDRARQSVDREAVPVSASPEEEAVRVAVDGLVERVQYLEAYSDEQVNILKLAHEEAVRQIEAVVKERDEFREAIRKNSVAVIQNGVYSQQLWCIHCQRKLELPSEAIFEHAPDCIVLKIEKL